MKEQMEEFKCPNCGASNNVIFNEKEASREIPCTSCFFEEWIAGKPIESSKTLDEAKGTYVFTKFEETTKVEHGVRFTAVKGEGTIVNG